MRMEKHIYHSICLGFVIILCCNLLGHYFPPFSLFCCFIYMNIIISFVNLPLYQKNFKLAVIYNFFILLLNDLLIRKYAGGSHDSAGMAWCLLMFGLTIIFSLLIMIIYSFVLIKEKSGISRMFFVIGGFLTTTIIYWFYNANV